MSISPITNPGGLLGELTDNPLSRAVLSPVKRVAFWAAVVLPFLHVPLLTTGLDSEQAVLAFAVLVSLNVCALLLGHPHGQE